MRQVRVERMFRIVEKTKNVKGGSAILMVPSNAVFEGRSCSAKNVKGTAYCQINLATTAILDKI
jgi:hypothetical protein